MKSGQASTTAEMVCEWRAMVHGASPVTGYSDPTAFTLASPEARARVERFRTKAWPRSLREAIGRFFQDKRAQVMALRTVAIDEAVRSARHPQVVILGAGLDGRAWRMPEFRDAVVFEVDHPDTQRLKRERAASLTPTARDVRFTPVDFTRDSLEQALASAGHQPDQPTTWIWEGVVMYLDLPAIEATMSTVAARSAPGSCLVVVYIAPSRLLAIGRIPLRRMGEPLRSVFTPETWAALAQRYGFTTVRDEGIPDLTARLAPSLSRGLRRVRHLRVATSEKR